MTDRSEKQPNGRDKEGPGVQLRRAREAKGLLVHDIAQELHLDEWMLQALEEDDFTALGAPVFAKGHMRKYGTTKEHYARIAAKNHTNGSLNPHAQFQTPRSMEDVLASPMIADPLTRMMCSISAQRSTTR